jgi:hypothetical protein
MIPASGDGMVLVPPPAYHRAWRKRRPALHLDALTLVTRLHLLSLCRLAVRLAQCRCPPPLPAGRRAALKLARFGGSLEFLVKPARRVK